MMEALVLAGGEGSRLAAAGTPKPLVEIGGRPLVVRLVDELASLGFPRVTCMARDDLVDAMRDRLRGAAVPTVVCGCRTPSSLHTLALGLATLEDGPVFCTMVDTLMPRDDWRRVHEGLSSALARGADAVLAVTPFVDDETPLYAGVDPSGRITGLGAAPIGSPRVTGGVYGFAPSARRAAAEAVRAGQQRLRVFLTSAVDAGMRVVGVEVPRILDIDRPSDVSAAERWLAEPSPGGVSGGRSSPDGEGGDA